MKIFKLLLPVLINIVLTVLYFIFLFNYLIFNMRPDFYYDIEMRIGYYNFGVGSISVSFVIWLFWATVIFIVRVGKKYLKSFKKVIYYICTIGIVGAVDLYWLISYDKSFF